MEATAVVVIREWRDLEYAAAFRFADYAIEFRLYSDLAPDRPSMEFIAEGEEYRLTGNPEEARPEIHGWVDSEGGLDFATNGLASFYGVQSFEKLNLAMRRVFAFALEFLGDQVKPEDRANF